MINADVQSSVVIVLRHAAESGIVCTDSSWDERAVLTASSWQARQPIYSDSIQRWKRDDKYLGGLKDGLAAREE